MKKIISILIAFSVFTAMCSGMFAYAADDGEPLPHAHIEDITAPAFNVKATGVVSLPGGYKYYSAVFTNPIYEAEASEHVPEPGLPVPAAYYAAAGSSEEYTEGIEAAADIMREHMKNRISTFTINMRSSVYPDPGELTRIASEAFRHTGNPKEGDYIRFQLDNWSARNTFHYDGVYYYSNITFNVNYFTDASQESEVDSIVGTLVKEFSAQKTDHDRIAAAYEYICDHVAYDYGNLYNDNYMLKYTAYAALKKGTSVCQGYSVLLYRLALELGIDSRIITGIGNNGNHAWNIIKLKGKYYNADSTWDETNKPSYYRYFLKCDANFTDHQRGEAYDSSEFRKAYPMADRDYENVSCGGDHSPAAPVEEHTVRATCTTDGSYEEVIYCSVCGEELQRKKVTVSATGHVWNDWVIVEPATEASDGLKERECSVCGTKETQMIPMIGKSAIGDVNADGSINVADATLIMQILAEWDMPEGIVVPNADLNGNGKTDVQDATLILQHIAGWFD